MTAQHTPTPWTDKLTPLIKSGSVLVLLNGVPPKTDCRVLAEENFQLAKNAVNCHEELVEALKFAVENLHEINPSNYDHDEVCQLNNKSVEVAVFLQAALAKAGAV